MGPSSANQLALYSPSSEEPYSLAHLLGTTATAGGVEGAASAAGPARWHAKNVMLNCQHCKWVEWELGLGGKSMEQRAQQEVLCCDLH